MNDTDDFDDDLAGWTLRDAKEWGTPPEAIELSQSKPYQFEIRGELLTITVRLGDALGISGGRVLLTRAATEALRDIAQTGTVGGYVPGPLDQIHWRVSS